jgi:hypothetical protein
LGLVSLVAVPAKSDNECRVGIDLEEGELGVDFDGRKITYGFGELEELVLAYATTIHESQGLGIPAVDPALSDAATEPGLHRGDPRQMTESPLRR